MLRGITDQRLRLGYRTLIGHHGLGPSFGFASGGRNKPFPGSICERKRKNVIAFAGASFSWFSRRRNETRPLSLMSASLVNSKRGTDRLSPLTRSMGAMTTIRLRRAAVVRLLSVWGVTSRNPENWWRGI